MTRRMTIQGYADINREIEDLWATERPRIVEEVYQAALLGDRSENASYIYGKKRLREIDSRLAYLKRQIESVLVIDFNKQMSKETVDFGAFVTIQNIDDDDAKAVSYRIVDQMEADPDQKRLSIQSPLGKSLLNKRIGDDVELNLPRGTIIYEILEIHYGPDPE
jgi:transcription elongation factor GreB